MKGLVIVLAVLATLAAVFLGGCGVFVMSIATVPDRYINPDGKGAIPLALTGLVVLILSVFWFIANAALVRSLWQGKPLHWRRLVVVLAVLDLACAVVSLLFFLYMPMWILGFCVFGTKGVFTLRWVFGRPPEPTQP